MKNSILMVLAVLCAASNLSAVRRQDATTAAQDLVTKQAQVQADEQAKAAAAATQSKPKAQKIKKQTQEKQEANAQQAPQNDMPKTEDAPKKEQETTASSTTSTKEAPQEQEVPVVAAQASSYAARALKVGAVVGFAGVVGASTLAACKAYMLANPVVYPVLVHNTIAGVSWCFANCI